MNDGDKIFGILNKIENKFSLIQDYLILKLFLQYSSSLAKTKTFEVEKQTMTYDTHIQPIQ